MINKKKTELNKAEKAAAKQSPKRVSRKTLRRRRMIKRLLGMLAVAVVAAAAIFAAMKLLFVVRTVDIKGIDIFTVKEISDFVAIPQEENIFKIDTEAIEISLVEEFTYIDSAKVIKRLPDRIDITLEDSHESFYAIENDKYAVYSQSFKKLRNSSEPPQGQSVFRPTHGCRLYSIWELCPQCRAAGPPPPQNARYGLPCRRIWR